MICGLCTPPADVLPVIKDVIQVRTFKNFCTKLKETKGDVRNSNVIYDQNCFHAKEKKSNFAMTVANVHQTSTADDN